MANLQEKTKMKEMLNVFQYKKVDFILKIEHI